MIKTTIFFLAFSSILWAFNFSKPGGTILILIEDIAFKAIEVSPDDEVTVENLTNNSFLICDIDGSGVFEEDLLEPGDILQLDANPQAYKRTIELYPV